MFGQPRAVVSQALPPGRWFLVSGVRVEPRLFRRLFAFQQLEVFGGRFLAPAHAARERG